MLKTTNFVQVYMLILAILKNIFYMFASTTTTTTTTTYYSKRWFYFFVCVFIEKNRKTEIKWKTKKSKAFLTKNAKRIFSSLQKKSNSKILKSVLSKIKINYQTKPVEHLKLRTNDTTTTVNTTATTTKFIKGKSFLKQMRNYIKIRP